MVVAITSTTQPALKLEDVVASFLSKDMRRKFMENHSMDSLSKSVRSKERRYKFTMGRSKSRGRSRSPETSLKKLCWKCGKSRHFKKYCRSKSVEIRKESDDTTLTKAKSSSEGGNVYLASIITQLEKKHMADRLRCFFSYESS